jgi:hypothetical protein
MNRSALQLVLRRRRCVFEPGVVEFSVGSACAGAGGGVVANLAHASGTRRRTPALYVREGLAGSAGGSLVAVLSSP